MISGKFSHAFSKGPFLDLGGTFKGGEYEEVFDKVELTPKQLELAHKCDSTITDLLKKKGLTDGTPLLYGRYDMV